MTIPVGQNWPQVIKSTSVVPFIAGSFYVSVQLEIS